MKKTDIIKLRLKGVSAEEIKQLMELEALADDSEDEAPATEAPKAEESVPSEAPAEEPEEEKDIPSDGVEEAKKEIEELKAQLAAAQKANTQMDISGAIVQGPTDQERINDLVASFM